MNTIAQSSATFIAITAGFFTTKIISLSSEKSRLSRTEREKESELRILTEKENEYRNQIDNQLEKGASEIIDDFENAIYTDPPNEYQIKNGEDILRYFKEYYGRQPNEIESAYLEARTESILTHVKALNKEKDNRLGGIEIPNITRAIRSDSDKMIDYYRNHEEDKEFRLKIDTWKNTRADIARLKQSIALINEELMDVTYPEHARLGFFSFVLFAILGVIIPLTYRLWATYLLDLSKEYAIIVSQLNNANHIVVGLFSLGLAINFCYIALEVYPSFKSRWRKHRF